MADIKKYAVSPTAELHLRDAEKNLMYAQHDENGQGVSGTEMKAVLYGPASTQYRVAMQNQSNELVDLIKQKQKTSRSIEDSLTKNAEFLSSITKELRNLEYGDEALQGEALFMAVYSDPELGFLSDQIAGWVQEWGNFSKPSEKS